MRDHQVSSWAKLRKSESKAFRPQGTQTPSDAARAPPMARVAETHSGMDHNTRGRAGWWVVVVLTGKQNTGRRSFSLEALPTFALTGFVVA